MLTPGGRGRTVFPRPDIRAWVAELSTVVAQAQAAAHAHAATAPAVSATAPVSVVPHNAVHAHAATSPVVTASGPVDFTIGTLATLADDWSFQVVATLTPSGAAAPVFSLPDLPAGLYLERV